MLFPSVPASVDDARRRRPGPSFIECSLTAARLPGGEAWQLAERPAPKVPEAHYPLPQPQQQQPTVAHRLAVELLVPIEPLLTLEHCRVEHLGPRAPSQEGTAPRPG